jgi:hypothetical protein
MLLKAMSEQRPSFHAAGTDSSALGLRALALLLP